MKSLPPDLPSLSKTALIAQINLARARIYADSTTTEAEKESLFTAALHELLTPSETARPYQVREVTILFAEIQNFAVVFETLSSPVIIEIVNRYIAMISELIVSKFHGSVNKILSNSIMASFETPIEQPDTLLAALTCAIEMQMAMEEINETNRSLHLPLLHIGIGINSGTVIAGQFGSPLYNEYTFIGNAINIAAHCKNGSLRGQILISEASYQRVKQQIETGVALPVLMKETKKSIYLYPLYAVKQPSYLALPKVKTRQSPRVLVNVPIRYQCVEESRLNSEFYDGEIIDISYGGMFACVAHPPKLYSEIKFCLPLSLWHEKYRDVYAKVLTLSKEEGKFYVGTVFMHLDEDTQFAIKQVVDIIRESIAFQYLDILPFQPL
jgi:adenylate cyclase